VKLAESAADRAIGKASLLKSRKARSSAYPPCRAGRHAEGLCHSHLHGCAEGVVAESFSDWDSQPAHHDHAMWRPRRRQDGQDLLVKYKDGEKKVSVAARYYHRALRAAQRTTSRLAPRSRCWRSEASRRTLLAPNVAVGRDIDPPQ